MINEARLKTRNEVSAEDLRRLPVGTIVIVHGFDRHGEHTQMECKIVSSGKGKALGYSTAWGPETIPIRKESDRRWYSLT